MPPSLLFSCYSYPPESCYLTINIDANDTNWFFVEEEQLRKVVCLKLIRVMGIVNAEASSSFE